MIFIHILKQLPQYLLQGFGAMVGIFLLIALWQFGYQVYGELVLPEPLLTFNTAIQLISEPDSQTQIWITVKRSVTGFLLASVLGLFLGILAGSFSTIALLLRPLITIFMGMPPIAWIVLTMIWFGMGDISVIFTLVLAILPITFIGALQGMQTLQSLYAELADAFDVPWSMRMTDIVLPHLFSYIFPSLTTALGMSWKIVVMAELLASSDGIGMMLAIANTQLDMNMALGLVVVVVAILLLFEYLLMEPIKREVEKWRQIK